MAHITGIGFSNFRVFKQSTLFDFAPITVFTGTNSSGKSSIFKGLKLLNNNAEDLSYLKFSGEGHKLGTFHTATSRTSDSEFIRFCVKLHDKKLFIIDYKPSRSGNLEGGYWEQFFVTKEDVLKDHYNEDELLLKVSHDDDGSGIKMYFNLKYQRSILLEKRKESGSSSSTPTPNQDAASKEYGRLEGMNSTVVSPRKLIKLIPSLDIDTAKKLALQIDDIILESFCVRFTDYFFPDVHVLYKNFYQIFDDFEFFSRLSNITCALLLKNTDVDFKIQDQLGNSSVSEIIEQNSIYELKEEAESKVKAIASSIKSATTGIHYLESIRANSQRLYSNQSQGTSFNELLLQIDNIWSKKDKREKNPTLKFADKWLRKFGIGDKLIITRIKGIATEVVIERGGEVVDLIDMGYGVTQFLPILLTVCSKLDKKIEHMLTPIDFLFNLKEAPLEDYKIDNNSMIRLGGPLLLIEEPESNLHPRLQSLLADFFIDVAKTFEVMLLIETHSEYLIRRLQVLTAAREVKPEHSVIYYLDGNLPSESDKFVTKININSDGSLTNDFGPGFIDEATNWKMELMRLKNAQLHNLN